MNDKVIAHIGSRRSGNLAFQLGKALLARMGVVIARDFHRTAMVVTPRIGGVKIGRAFQKGYLRLLLRWGDMDRFETLFRRHSRDRKDRATHFFDNAKEVALKRLPDLMGENLPLPYVPREYGDHTLRFDADKEARAKASEKTFTRLFALFMNTPNAFAKFRDAYNSRTGWLAFGALYQGNHPIFSALEGRAKNLGFPDMTAGIVEHSAQTLVRHRYVKHDGNFHNMLYEWGSQSWPLARAWQSAKAWGYEAEFRRGFVTGIANLATEKAFTGRFDAENYTEADICRAIHALYLETREASLKADFETREVSLGRSFGEGYWPPLKTAVLTGKEDVFQTYYRRACSSPNGRSDLFEAFKSQVENWATEFDAQSQKGYLATLRGFCINTHLYGLLAEPVQKKLGPPPPGASPQRVVVFEGGKAAPGK
ncbi:MAG: hypothetical protein HY053_09815 [Proteobacteria bacterium]|nr:hypothetical protein [Pseudomonadota bacterium]